MSLPQVESGLPIPTAKGGSWTRRYPWVELKVGDSFLVTDRTQLQVVKAANMASKRYGGKHVTRVVPGGVRVWRVE